MTTKLEAARVAMRAGVTMVIASGREAGTIRRVLAGEAVGTVFPAKEAHLRVRKSWIAFGKRLAGEVVVDAGCVAALAGGASLLAAGICAAEGDFAAGAALRVLDTEGREVARGITNYGAADLVRLIGHRTEEFSSLVAGARRAEIIHRDNLVLMV